MRCGRAAVTKLPSLRLSCSFLAITVFFFVRPNFFKKKEQDGYQQVTL